MTITNIENAVSAIHTEFTKLLMLEETGLSDGEFQALEDSEESLNEARTELAQYSPDAAVSDHYRQKLRELFPPHVIAEHIARLPPASRFRLAQQFPHMFRNLK